MELNKLNLTIIFILATVVLAVNTRYNLGWVSQFITGFVAVVVAFILVFPVSKQVKQIREMTNISNYESKFQDIENKFSDLFKRFETFGSTISELSSKVASLPFNVPAESAMSEGKTFSVGNSADILFDHPDMLEASTLEVKADSENYLKFKCVNADGMRVSFNFPSDVKVLDVDAPAMVVDENVVEFIATGETCNVKVQTPKTNGEPVMAPINCQIRYFDQTKNKQLMLRVMPN